MGRVVVVTGASGRVGRACAEAFARQGDSIALLARHRDRLEDVALALADLGARTLVVPVDVSDPDAVEVAVDRVEVELGPIDVLVNAASSSGAARFEDTAPEDFRRITQVGYLGVVHTTMSVLERLQERDRGTIVQVGSSLAYRGSAFRTACSGAQHAVQGFTEALRTELAGDGSGVRVTLVHLPPGDDAAVAARAVVRAAEEPGRRVRTPRPDLVPVGAGARC